MMIGTKKLLSVLLMVTMTAVGVPSYAAETSLLPETDLITETQGEAPSVFPVSSPVEEALAEEEAVPLSGTEEATAVPCSETENTDIFNGENGTGETECIPDAGTAGSPVLMEDGESAEGTYDPEDGEVPGSGDVLQTVTDSTSEEAFTWDGNVITGYNGGATDLVIPKRATKIGGRVFIDKKLSTLQFESGSVCTSIGYSAFCGCGLTRVELPDSLTTIESNAFQNNNIREIILPRKLQTLGYMAFGDNMKLSKVTVNAEALSTDGSSFYSAPIRQIIFGSAVTYVARYLFHRADLSETSLTIPSQITEIMDYAFCDSGLKSVTFEGDALEKIDDEAFYNTGLTEITVPEHLKTLGFHAFGNCDRLKKISYNTISISSGNRAFEEVRPTSVTIGNNVREIPSSLFNSCILTDVSLDIPVSVTTIGSSAFCYSNLSVVTFHGNNLRKIGPSAFSNCPVRNLNLPSSVAEIGTNAFAYNTSLVTCVVPKKLKSLEYGVFQSSDETLETVAIYKSTKISSDPFSGCKRQLLVIYGYSGSDAEEYAQKNGYTFRSIDDWPGGNPYGTGDVGDDPEIISDGGRSGLDGAVELVSTGSKTMSAQMVKGQKFTFGKGKWSSDSRSVVTIAAKSGAATAKGAGTAVLTEEKSGTTVTVTVFSPSMQGAKKYDLVAGGEGAKLLLSGMEGATMPVTWQSSNCEIASVKGNGTGAEVTPLGKGSAKITAWVGGKAYTTSVAVKDVYAVPKLTGEDSISLAVMQTANLSYTNGFKAADAVWTDSEGNSLGDDSAVSIIRGRLTAVKPVDSMTLRGNDGSREVALTVTARVIPTRSVLYINRGSTRSLKNTLANGKSIHWSTSGTGVSLTGADRTSVKIKGQSTGTITLTCLYNGVSFETKVIVEDPTPKSRSISMYIGEMSSVGLRAVTQPVIFRSSRSKVAFVDENGDIYARARGNTVISARVNGKTVKIKVKVRK